MTRHAPPRNFGIALSQQPASDWIDDVADNVTPSLALFGVARVTRDAQREQENPRGKTRASGFTRLRFGLVFPGKTFPAQIQKTQAMEGVSSQNIPSLARQASIFSLGIAHSVALRLAPRVSRLLRVSGVRVKRK